MESVEEADLTPLTEGKTFKFEIKTNKNNSYLIIFTLGNDLEIKANQINGLVKKSFANQFSFMQIRENKYFLQFDSLNEIMDELNERIKNNQIIIEENDNSLILNIPLPSSKNKEISFELREKSKNTNEKINDLAQLIINLNKEISDLKNENTQFKNEMTQLKNETTQLKNQITQFKNETTQFKNENAQLKNENAQFKNEMTQFKTQLTQLKNENPQLKNDTTLFQNQITQLKNENTQLKNETTQLKNENTQLKNNDIQMQNEISELKEKINILWKDKEEEERSKSIIGDLNSKIIQGNEEYNKRLKTWINPSKK